MDLLTLELRAWRRTMRRFFLIELPAAALSVGLWVQAWRALPADAGQPVRLAIIAGLLTAIALAGYVWFSRIPPPRPARYPPVAPCPD